MLAVVLEIVNISARSGVAVDSGVALGATATTQGLANDTRFPNLGATSRCTVVTGALAATVALAQDDLAVGKTSTRPYILVPGKKLFIINLAVNVGCEASLMWTERPLLAGEGAI